MYSGFINSKRTVPGVGVHQRFDTAARRIADPYFAVDSFPARRQIIHFEGVNGPDGVKAKSPGRHDPSHLYNPQTGEGELVELIRSHYQALVRVLKGKDLVRAAFEAAWLAHFVCDGLTPAHHFPLDEKLAPFAEAAKKAKRPARYKHRVLIPGETPIESLKQSWAVWGGKGLLLTHFNFEMGVAAALVGYRMRAELNQPRLAVARSLGVEAFFRQEAQTVAALHMYEDFYQYGWTTEMARLVRQELAPRIVQAIAIIWLLAYLEAGYEIAKTSITTIKDGQ